MNVDEIMNQDSLGAFTKKGRQAKGRQPNKVNVKRYTDRHHLEGGERNKRACESVSKKRAAMNRTQKYRAKKARLEQLQQEIQAEPESDPAKRLEMEKLEKEIGDKKAKQKAATKKCRDKKSNFPLVQYHHMKAIAPPTTKSTGLDLVQDLDLYLQKNSTFVKEQFDKYSVLADSPVGVAGIRLINGDRYEVFVNDSAGKGTGIFDWLLGEVEKDRTKDTGTIPRARVEQLRRDIIVYAHKRAKKDTRVGKDTIFQNHALIVSFGRCEQQDVHIDLAEKGHFQFGLLCTNNVFGTLEYSPQEPMIGTDCNLADVWNDIPQALATNLLQHNSTKSLLESFGSLLSVSESTHAETTFPLGTLLCLPGNVPHAGPSSDKLRAVMFFTGTPPGETPYAYDTQHSRTTLISEILMHNWIPLQENDDNFEEHRKYLLMKWDKVGLQKDKFALKNMHHGHLIKFGKDIMKTKGDEEKKIDVIKELAKRKWKEKTWEETSQTSKAKKKGRAHRPKKSPV